MVVFFLAETTYEPRYKEKETSCPNNGKLGILRACLKLMAQNNLEHHCEHILIQRNRLYHMNQKLEVWEFYQIVNCWRGRFCMLWPSRMGCFHPWDHHKDDWMLGSDWDWLARVKQNCTSLKFFWNFSRVFCSSCAFRVFSPPGYPFFPKPPFQVFDLPGVQIFSFHPFILLEPFWFDGKP